MLDQTAGKVIPKEKEKSSADEKSRWKRFKVDLWATDFNTTEIGIMRHTEHRSKSRQFTSDMEIIGQVSESGERTNLIGYRQEPWDKSEGMDRRLVIKLFSETLSWHGSLDLMLGRSLQLTVGAGGVPCAAYSINLARHEQLIQVERSAMKIPGFPEQFSFFVMEDEGAHYFTLRRCRIGLGADYELFDAAGNKLGKLNGRLVNLGGAWKVKLLKTHATPRLEGTLKLFCAMLRFNGKVRAHIERLARDMEKGQLLPKIPHQEDDLYMNPRRVR